MKNVCIIGTGPAGLYTAKYLLPHFKITAYERSSQPYGLFKYFYKSDPTHFNTVITHPNFTLKTNINAKDINKNHDAYVIATGGESRILNIIGKELLLPSLDIIKQYKNITDASQNKLTNFKDKDVMIVGCGNVSMDLVKYLVKDAKEMHLLCRNGPYNLKCSNVELRDIYDLKDVKIGHNVNLQDEYNLKSEDSKRRSIENRKKIYEQETCGNKKINFIYHSNLEKVEKVGNKLVAFLNTCGIKKQILVDRIISSIGFVSGKNDLKIENKPLFFVGWVKNPVGNLLNVKQDAYETAQKVLNYFKII